MSKFHISRDGIPRKCNATKNPCPLGGQENYFNNMEDALEARNNKSNNMDYCLEHKIISLPEIMGFLLVNNLAIGLEN